MLAPIGGGCCLAAWHCARRWVPASRFFSAPLSTETFEMRKTARRHQAKCTTPLQDSRGASPQGEARRECAAKPKRSAGCGGRITGGGGRGGEKSATRVPCADGMACRGGRKDLGPEATQAIPHARGRTGARKKGATRGCAERLGLQMWSEALARLDHASLASARAPIGGGLLSCRLSLGTSTSPPIAPFFPVPPYGDIRKASPRTAPSSQVHHAPSRQQARARRAKPGADAPARQSEAKPR